MSTNEIAQVKVEVVGTAPLLMHNRQLADPLNSWSRMMAEITKKRKKTDQELLSLREYEWNGGLYHDDTIGPYVPAEWIEGVIREGAKDVEKGLQKKITASISVAEDMIPLEYNGPRDRTELYAKPEFVDIRGAGVNGNTVMRTRPRFLHPWYLNFTLFVITAQVDLSVVRTCLEKGGMYRAIGDYKPRFGRFAVKNFK